LKLVSGPRVVQETRICTPLTQPALNRGPSDELHWPYAAHSPPSHAYNRLVGRQFPSFYWTWNYLSCSHHCTNETYHEPDESSPYCHTSYV